MSPDCILLIPDLRYKLVILIRLSCVYSARLPSLAVGLLMLTVTPQTAGENYEYGRVQAAIVLFVLITTLVGESIDRCNTVYSST